MQVVDSKAPATVTPNTAPVLCDAPAAQPKKLQQLVAEAIAVRHYSKRTNEAYWYWIKQFVLWSGKRHPETMGQAEVDQFLTEHHIDHETKTIIRRDGRPLHNAGAGGELANLQNALKQLAADFANSIWKKAVRVLVRQWVAPSRAHQKRYHRNPKRRALRK